MKKVCSECFRQAYVESFIVNDKLPLHSIASNEESTQKRTGDRPT